MHFDNFRRFVVRQFFQTFIYRGSINPSLITRFERFNHSHVLKKKKRTMKTKNNFEHDLDLQKKNFNKWINDFPKFDRDDVEKNNHNFHWITTKIKTKREQYKTHIAKIFPRNIRNTTHANKQLIWTRYTKQFQFSQRIHKSIITFETKSHTNRRHRNHKNFVISQGFFLPVYNPHSMSLNGPATPATT